MGEILNLLKNDCVICNLRERQDNENRCTDCNFVIGGNYY